MMKATIEADHEATPAPKSLADTLARVRAGADQRKAAAEDAYRKLVRRCADGAEIDPAQVVRQLDEWGKTAEDFERDVDAISRRLLWRSEVQQLPDLRSRLATTEGKLREADEQYAAAIQEANRKYSAAVTPLKTEQAALERTIRTSEQAEQKLAETAPAERHDRVKDLQLQVVPARQLVLRLEAELAEFPALVAKAEAEVRKKENMYSSSDVFVTDPTSFQYQHGLQLKQRDLEAAKQAVPTEEYRLGIIERLEAARKHVRELEQAEAEARAALLIV
jgi:hypothetical protein